MRWLIPLLAVIGLVGLTYQNMTLRANQVSMENRMAALEAENAKLRQVILGYQNRFGVVPTDGMPARQPTPRPTRTFQTNSPFR